MSIESEAMGIVEEAARDEATEIAAEMAEPPKISILSWLVEVFRVETGPGEIKEYQDSPLCFDGSVGLGQILRGVSGFAGANFLRSAVLDVIVGAMRWDKGGRADA